VVALVSVLPGRLAPQVGRDLQSIRIKGTLARRLVVLWLHLVRQLRSRRQ